MRKQKKMIGELLMKEDWSTLITWITTNSMLYHYPLHCYAREFAVDIISHCIVSRFVIANCKLFLFFILFAETLPFSEQFFFHVTATVSDWDSMIVLSLRLKLNWFCEFFLTTRFYPKKISNLIRYLINY